MVAAAAVLSLAGCNNNKEPNSGDSNTPGNSNSNDPGNQSGSGDKQPASIPAGPQVAATDEQKNAGKGTVDVSDEGKTLVIACWNKEFREFFEGFYTLPEGVTVEWVEHPNKDGVYQNKLDELLPKNDSASEEKKIDIFLAEADYIKKYAESDFTQDIGALGVGNYDTMYRYTIDAATDGRTGAVKGVSFQACPSGVIVRKSIAKEVLGTDDPDEIQSKIDTWEKFNEVAKTAKDKGYYMTASALETYRAFANNATTSYLSADNKFAPTEAFNTWLAQAEDYVKNGYTIATDLWDGDKQDQMFADGKTMCFFGPAWYYNFSMTNAINPDKGCAGDWCVVVGPQEHFWGGTWLLASSTTDNPKLVADVFNAFTANEEICMKLADGTKVHDYDTGGEKSNVQFPNNKNIVNTCANDPAFGNTVILGGQNDVAVMAKVADGIKWDTALHTPYDQTFNETLPNDMLEYLKGNYSTVDAAMNKFYSDLAKVDPRITH